MCLPIFFLSNFAVLYLRCPLTARLVSDRFAGPWKARPIIIEDRYTVTVQEQQQQQSGGGGGGNSKLSSGGDGSGGDDDGGGITLPEATAALVIGSSGSVGNGGGVRGVSSNTFAHPRSNFDSIVSTPEADDSAKGGEPAAAYGGSTTAAYTDTPNIGIADAANGDAGTSADTAAAAAAASTSMLPSALSSSNLTAPVKFKSKPSTWCLSFFFGTVGGRIAER